MIDYCYTRILDRFVVNKHLQAMLARDGDTLLFQLIQNQVYQRLDRYIIIKTGLACRTE